MVKGMLEKNILSTIIASTCIFNPINIYSCLKEVLDNQKHAFNPGSYMENLNVFHFCRIFHDFSLSGKIVFFYESYKV